MTQKLDLNKMGLAPLTDIESMQIEGGNTIKYVIKIIEFLGILDALQDIGEGFRAGYQQARKH
jgi:hypothetical protein